jgi:hypothetical protein
MDMFKKKSLYTALAGLSALGAVGTAQAVNLNPDGLGQVLIYPYYTVRNDAAGDAYNSLLSVVNSTASVKAVKVRFIEGKNSREVLDFNLYLSPKDVWTTAVIPNSSGGGTMITTDKSCTLPAIPAAGVAFRNTFYASDGAGAGLDRTAEGYVEIIEMATYADDSDTAANVTHVGGVPPGCAKQTDSLGASEALPPTGGLFGGITLINVNSGTDFTADAVALDNFSDSAQYTGTTLDTPNLTQASPPVSIVVAEGAVFQSVWAPSTADPVSAVLMHDHIMNEYVLDAATKSGTDWVITMPTKRYYVSNGTGTPPTLFQRNFNKTAGACDDVDLFIYDREEQTTSTPLDFSPPPVQGTTCLPWEANVLTFSNSKVLGSANSVNVDVASIGFENGWLDLGFQPSTVTPPIHQLINLNTTIAPLGGAPSAPTAVTYNGLPVIGFAVQSFFNGTLKVGDIFVQSSYGGNFVQKGSRGIFTGVLTP